MIAMHTKPKQSGSVCQHPSLWFQASPFSGVIYHTVWPKLAPGEALSVSQACFKHGGAIWCNVENDDIPTCITICISQTVTRSGAL